MKPRTPWEIQKSVVFALFIRELKTRAGSYRLGYAWTLLSPLAMVIIFTVIFSFRGREAVPGVDLPLFMITGVVTFFLFQTIVTQCVASFSSNAGLFYYKQVKPFDTLIARTLLECIIHLFVFVVLISSAAWLGYETAMDDIFGVVVILCLVSLFAFGTGLVFAVVVSLYEDMGKVVPILMRPLFFLSAVFYPLAWIPQEYRGLLLWNPLLHAIELGRQAYFKLYTVPEVSVFYLAICTLIVCTFGMALYRLNWYRVVAS